MRAPKSTSQCAYEAFTRMYKMPLFSNTSEAEKSNTDGVFSSIEKYKRRKYCKKNWLKSKSFKNNEIAIKISNKSVYNRFSFASGIDFYEMAWQSGPLYKQNTATLCLILQVK